MTPPADHYDVIQLASRALRDHLPLFREERRICREAYEQMRIAGAATDLELEQEEPFEREDRPLCIVPISLESASSGPRAKGSVQYPILQRLAQHSPKGMRGTELMKGLAGSSKERQNGLSNTKKRGYIRHNKTDGLWYLTPSGEEKWLTLSVRADRPSAGALNGKGRVHVRRRVSAVSCSTS